MAQRTNLEKVIEFHNCAGHPVFKVPQYNIFDEKPERVKFRLGLVQEEVKELEQAVKEKNFKEVIDALSDISYVINGMAAEFGINLDRSFDIVHKSNMTKFCSTEEEAIQTVEWYKQQYKDGKLSYKSPAYRRSPDGIHWVVYNQDNDKALKSINYTPANFDEQES